MALVFGDRLKSARLRADLKQSDLAKKVGLSQSTINRIEKGVAKGTTKLIEIADVLDVSPEWLSKGSTDYVVPQYKTISDEKDEKNEELNEEFLGRLKILENRINLLELRLNRVLD